MNHLPNQHARPSDDARPPLAFDDSSATLTACVQQGWLESLLGLRVFVGGDRWSRKLFGSDVKKSHRRRIW
jgi:hypothetical protein